MKHVVLLLLLLLPISGTRSQTLSSPKPAATSSDSSSSQIQKIGEDLYRLGSITIDSKKRELSLPGKFNMQKGMIELLACSVGGKVHESVLVLDVVPYHLQVALLLLGLNFKGGLEFQGDPKAPKGDSVVVRVTWKNGDRDTTVRLEQLAWEVSGNKPMERTEFVFVGSKMVEGKFMADVEKSLITTYHDPYTILDNPLSTGANDEVYKVNETLVPVKGTPFILTINTLR